jgi:hypothetical protein
VSVSWPQALVLFIDTVGFICLHLRAAYSNFREWNPDPEIADVAQRLYNDIENLELYVGENSRHINY